MVYSKLNDIPFMLTDLCMDFNDADQQNLIRLSAKLELNSKMKQSYLKILQQKYMQELSSIINGTYEKVPFEQLNKTILSKWTKMEFMKHRKIFSSAPNSNETKQKTESARILQKIKQIKLKN